jgi:hypothetical protein
MEFFKGEIKVTNKTIAKDILSKMQSGDVTEIHLPVVPKEEIEKFLNGERPNLWNIMVDGEVTFEVVTSKKVAKAVLDMINFYQKDELPLAPIVQDNLQAFISGKRKNVAEFEIASAEPGEELPGHIS